MLQRDSWEVIRRQRIQRPVITGGALVWSPASRGLVQLLASAYIIASVGVMAAQAGEDSLKKEMEVPADLPTPRRVLGVRHFQASLIFGGLLMAYYIRMVLSVAIVQMPSSTDSKVELDSGERALVLSSFFWGYCLLQIPLANLGRKGHAVKLISAANIAGGILTLAMPLTALYFGVTGMCVVRFITGLVQGCVIPNNFNLMAKWVIPEERVAVFCLVNSGGPIGILISMGLSGYLGYQYDWPSIFYVSGSVAVVWGLVQLMAGAESPQTARHISSEEQDFMEFSFQAAQGQEKRSSVPKKIPWRSILTSGPVLAILFTMWCNCWGAWTVLTLTPSYISGALHFDLEDDGLLSSLPQVAAGVVGLSISYISTCVKRTTGLPDSFLRPMWNSIAMYGSSLGLLLLAYVPSEPSLAIAFLVSVSALIVVSYAGHGVSHLEIAPNLAGVIMGLTNSLSATASILGPLISTYLVKDTGSKEQWQIVFLIAAMLMFFGNTVFLFWGTTKRQPWDQEEQSDSEKGV